MSPHCGLPGSASAGSWSKEQSQDSNPGILIRVAGGPNTGLTTAPNFLAKLLALKICISNHWTGLNSSLFTLKACLVLQWPWEAVVISWAFCCKPEKCLIIKWLAHSSSSLLVLNRWLVLQQPTQSPTPTSPQRETSRLCGRLLPSPWGTSDSCKRVRHDVVPASELSASNRDEHPWSLTSNSIHVEHQGCLD